MKVANEPNYRACHMSLMLRLKFALLKVITTLQGCRVVRNKVVTVPIPMLLRGYTLFFLYGY